MFSLLSFLSFLPTSPVYAVPNPPVDTMELTGKMSPVGSTSGTILGPSQRNYVDIVGDANNQPGGIWYNEPLDLSADFNLEMYFALDLPGGVNPSQGFAFVMQSTGPTALSQEGGQTLGVWANNSISNNNLRAGAIQDGFAVEFDTFYNNGTLFQNQFFDNGLSLLNDGGSHISWGFPGRESTYSTRYILFYGTRKIMNHRGVSPDVGINLDLNNWRKFTVSYDSSAGQLTYYAERWMNTPTVVDLFNPNDNSDDPVFNNPHEVYFGFTGANNNTPQQRSVALTKVEQNLPDPDEPKFELNGSLVVDDHTVLDANVSNENDVPTLELPFADFLEENNSEKKPFTYNVTATYTNEGDYPLVGSEITIDVPSILEVQSNEILVDINGQQKQFKLADGAIISEGEFKRVGDQYVFSLPELENNSTVSISLPMVVISDEDGAGIKNKKIQDTEIFSAVFRSKDEQILAETGELVNEDLIKPNYNLEAIFGPELESENVLFEDTQNVSFRIRTIDNEITHVPIWVTDLNSTSVVVYATNRWLDSDELSQLQDFDVHSIPGIYEEQLTFDRGDIIGKFDEQKWDFDRSELKEPGTFYKVFYAVDYEKNVSVPMYLIVTVEEVVRGTISLDAVPNFTFESINLSKMNELVDPYGFVNVNFDRRISGPSPGLEAYDGNDNLYLRVTTDNELPGEGWTLSASLGNFYMDGNRGHISIPADDIQIDFNVKNELKTINNSHTFIYDGKYDESLNETIPEESIQLRILQDSIRTTGVYRGVINWTLMDSIGMD